MRDEIIEWLGLGLICSLALTITCTSEAQSVISPQLALARICVSEEGLPDVVEERLVLRGPNRVRGQPWYAGCRAIHEVYLRGANRLLLRDRATPRTAYLEFARDYSPRVIGPLPTEPIRQWVTELSPRGRQPASWADRTRPPWSRYRRAWLSAYAAAGQIVRGTLDDVDEWSSCDRPVHHWGSASTRARARRAGWIETSCGPTANVFFHAPELHNEEVDVD